MNTARPGLLLAAAAALALLATGCSSGDARGNDGLLEDIRAATWTPAAPTSGAPIDTPEPDGSPSPSFTVDDPTPEPTAPPGPETYDPATFGFLYPIAGGCLPTSDALMPNAPRDYRGGTHEGVDFYPTDNCAPISLGTPVLAAAAGAVIRADLDYHDLTWEELDALNRRIAEGGANDPDVLDAFRGRQVWVRHGNGVVTRYAHLSAVAEGVSPGVRVAAGDVLGYVGDSGTPESLTNPGTEYHLHFEIRVGDTYLGAGLPPGEVRNIYMQVFSDG